MFTLSSFSPSLVHSLSDVIDGIIVEPQKFFFNNFFCSSPKKKEKKNAAMHNKRES
jgi:hypothetical protein